MIYDMIWYDIWYLNIFYEYKIKDTGELKADKGKIQKRPTTIKGVWWVPEYREETTRLIKIKKKTHKTLRYDF